MVIFHPVFDVLRRLAPHSLALALALAVTRRVAVWLVVMSLSWGLSAVVAGFPTMATAATAATAVPGITSQAGPSAESSSLQELAVVLGTLFPHINGTVTRVQGDRVEIDRGMNHGVRPGLLVGVVRPGAPFRHPLTGVVLGASETPLGVLVVESATADRAVTRLVDAPASEAVQAGDQVRTSEGRLPIALASTAASQIVTARFRAAIDETGRFQLLPFATSIPVPTLIGDSSFPAASGEAMASLVEAARALGADYLVLFDARLRPVGAMGAVVMLETRGGRRLDAVEMPLRLSPDELPAGSPTDPVDPLVQVMAAREGQAFRTMQFPYRAAHLIIGDLDGNGEPEVAVSDGSRLRVYGLKALSPELLAEESIDRADRRQLAVDLADINGTGHPQVFVTAMVGDQLDSYVLEWRDGGLARVVEHQPYFFRVLTPPKRPAMLVGQKRSLSALFYDHVMTLEWTGRDYREGEALTLPKGVAIYDFTVTDLTHDGRGQLLYLDRDDRLVLVDPDGRVLGKSRESFGGVESFIEYRPIAVNQSADQPPLRARIPARLTAADLDGDGVVEITVPHNIPLTKRIERIKGYRYGQIHGLRWDGRQFVEHWSIPRVEGVIADLAVAQLLGPGGGAQVMILVNPTTMDKVTDLKHLFAIQSQLLFYAMPQNEEKGAG
jgi:hypothetical protein